MPISVSSDWMISYYNNSLFGTETLIFVSLIAKISKGVFTIIIRSWSIDFRRLPIFRFAILNPLVDFSSLSNTELFMIDLSPVYTTLNSWHDTDKTGTLTIFIRA